MTTKLSPKDYLSKERERNIRPENRKLYQRLIQKAFGCQMDVYAGHHIVFQTHGDVSDVNEIPAADTLLFDHEVMEATFGGSRARQLMLAMIRVPCDEREALCIDELRDMDLKAAIYADEIADIDRSLEADTQSALVA